MTDNKLFGESHEPHEPHRLVPRAGNRIDHFFQDLVDYARTHQVDVEGELYGITFRVSAANPATVDELKAYYKKEMARREKEFRSSPEGAKIFQEQEVHKIELQQQADYLMAQLDSLDFGDLEAVIDWIMSLQAPSEYSGISFDRQRVLDVFQKHQFLHPGVNSGKVFNLENAEDFAKWLIGDYVLASIKAVGSIHPIVHRFGKQWKDKFGKNKPK